MIDVWRNSENSFKLYRTQQLSNHGGVEGTVPPAIANAEPIRVDDEITDSELILSIGKY